MSAASHMKDGDSSHARGRLLQGILPLDGSRIAPDLLAGVTLAALGIPEVMGYTKIIGTPVITGIYTMLLPMLVFVLFGSSRHLVVSADSATAAIVAAALVHVAALESPHYVTLTSVVALAHGAGRLPHRGRRAGGVRPAARDARDREGWARTVPDTGIHLRAHQRDAAAE